MRQASFFVARRRTGLTGAIDAKRVRTYDSTSSGDIGAAGGKNASLGEIFSRLSKTGIRVPAGFATTAGAYWRLLEHNGLEKPLRAHLKKRRGGKGPAKTGKAIRTLILNAEFPEEIE